MSLGGFRGKVGGGSGGGNGSFEEEGKSGECKQFFFLMGVAKGCWREDGKG